MAISDAASAAPLTEPGLQALGGDFYFRALIILQFAILILQLPYPLVARHHASSSTVAIPIRTSRAPTKAGDYLAFGNPGHAFLIQVKAIRGRLG
jgi:hypothetical protein